MLTAPGWQFDDGVTERRPQGVEPSRLREPRANVAAKETRNVAQGQGFREEQVCACLHAEVTVGREGRGGQQGDDHVADEGVPVVADGADEIGVRRFRDVEVEDHGVTAIAVDAGKGLGWRVRREDLEARLGEEGGNEPWRGVFVFEDDDAWGIREGYGDHMRHDGDILLSAIG